MAANNQQLMTDQQKVIETIKQYRNIKLISSTGKPATEYIIEYKLRGYSKTSSGKIKIIKQHRIAINLPFGYPNFPPTVKLISPLYHPDINAQILRIADHWKRNKSLAKLVIHIGEMICGKAYNNENPFDEKAAEYYRKHKNNLPLDSLQLVKKNTDWKTETSPRRVRLPIFNILATLTLLGMLAYGGVYFFEQHKINEAEAIFKRAHTLGEERDYKKAQATARSALEGLDKFYLLRPSFESLQNRVKSFLQSKLLHEGLQGRVLYDGEYKDIDLVHKLELMEPFITEANKLVETGDLDKAISTFEKALTYADNDNVMAEVKEIRSDLAQLKFQQLLSAAKTARTDKKYRQAVNNHKKVLALIKKEKEHLPDAVKKQAWQIRRHLFSDKVEMYLQEADYAEKKQDFEVALNNHNALIDLIGKSGSQSRQSLNSTLIASLKKVAALTEKVTIVKKRDWLLENFKAIFPQHYPTVITKALGNPEASFLRYEGNQLLFDLSCQEKGPRTIVKLRVYYLYDPDTEEWSVYTGEI